MQGGAIIKESNLPDSIRWKSQAITRRAPQSKCGDLSRSMTGPTTQPYFATAAATLPAPPQMSRKWNLKATGLSGSMSSWPLLIHLINVLEDGLGPRQHSCITGLLPPRPAKGSGQCLTYGCRDDCPLSVRRVCSIASRL